MGMLTTATVVSVTPIDPLLALLIGAFGAALLTVIGGLIGAWIQSVRDHRKWLRERRFEAYREFMIDMSQFSSMADIETTSTNFESKSLKLEALSDQMRRSSEAVSILGPRSVNAAGQDWVVAATNYFTDQSKVNKASMARGRWQFLIAVGEELGSKNVGMAPPVARPL